LGSVGLVKVAAGSTIWAMGITQNLGRGVHIHGHSLQEVELLVFFIISPCPNLVPSLNKPAEAVLEMPL
jgi:hypothetical protein